MKSSAQYAFRATVFRVSHDDWQCNVVPQKLCSFTFQKPFFQICFAHESSSRFRDLEARLVLNRTSQATNLRTHPRIVSSFSLQLTTANNKKHLLVRNRTVVITVLDIKRHVGRVYKVHRRVYLARPTNNIKMIIT